MHAVTGRQIILFQMSKEGSVRRSALAVDADAPLHACRAQGDDSGRGGSTREHGGSVSAVRERVGM